MRVFLHEFITSGALSDEPLPESLLREGLAMHRAVAGDLLKLPGVEVVTTRDSQLAEPAHPGILVETVSSPLQEADRFASLCARSDRTLIIAPEIGGELERRVRRGLSLAGWERLWNSPELVSEASDKWTTFTRLRDAGVPTIKTALATAGEWRTWDRPIVKPRDGAGSQGVHRLNTAADRESLCRAAPEGSIVQPFVQGRWRSCCVLFGAGGRRDVLLPAEQCIADDGSFTYLGGRSPAVCDIARVQSLALRAIQAFPCSDLLNGPIGVDLVEDEQTGELLVCEINPRFTTSYVAARELADRNLLEGLVNPHASPIRWKTGRVEFNAAGVVRSLS